MSSPHPIRASKTDYASIFSTMINPTNSSDFIFTISIAYTKTYLLGSQTILCLIGNDAPVFWDEVQNLLSYSLFTQ